MTVEEWRMLGLVMMFIGSVGLFFVRKNDE